MNCDGNWIEEEEEEVMLVEVYWNNTSLLCLPINIMICYAYLFCILCIHSFVNILSIYMLFKIAIAQEVGICVRVGVCMCVVSPWLLTTIGNNFMWHNMDPI